MLADLLAGRRIGLHNPGQLELTRRFLGERSRGLFGWAVGLASYTVLIIAFFPTIRDSPSFAQALDDYPDAMLEFLGGDAAQDLTSGPGFLSAELFSLIFPLLLAVMAIGFGASFGADQRSGLVDVLLSYLVPRWRLVAEKSLALVVATARLAGVVLVTTWAAGVFVDLDIGLNELAATTTGVGLLVALHGLIAIAVSSVTGRRSSAIGIATTVFAAGYLLNGLAGLVDWLEPARVISPYYHALGSNPLVEGWPIASFLFLAFACVALFLASMALFERRDLL
jgi:ABC-2 type transport system permease protein